MRQIKLGVIGIFISLTIVFYFVESRSLASAKEFDSPTAVSAPTSVSASDGDYSNKVGLHWDTIRGATLYRVFRNAVNNSATATDVGTTKANYFFDSTGVQGQTYFYWVRAENMVEVSTFSSPDQGTKAIGQIDPGPIAPLEPPNAPPGNELTAAKSYLGKALFWDEQLSSTKTVACGTCHQPGVGGADPRSAVGSNRSRNPGFDNLFGTDDDVFGSPGVPQNAADGNYSHNPKFGLREQVTGRKAPSYLNAGHSTTGLFWDGRALDAFRDQLSNAVLLPVGASLESQSAGPPLSAAEMAHGGRNWSQVAARVQVSRPLALASNIPAGLKTWIGDRMYPELFAEAFGSTDVTPARISMAIASHERTLFSDRTPLDRALYGIQPLTQQEVNGQAIFNTASCNICHDGPLGTGHQFFNIGVRPQIEDHGQAGVTMNPDDDGRFKTPGLRNIDLHGTYMHNGRFATLEEVVDFYDRGGDFKASNLAPAIRELGLSPQEKADLVAFIRRPWIDTRVSKELPPFDRPRLFTESSRVPVLSGVGRPLLAGTVPDAFAIEPPLLGNQNFTLAVSVSANQGLAYLVIDDVDPGIRTSVPTTASLWRSKEEIEPIATGGGYASINIAMPSDPAMVGRTFYGRWYIQDVRSRGRLAVSRVFSFTIFRAETDPGSSEVVADTVR
ncbi:MAG: cytochrome c peroxidase [Pyrinomonadaceae bacterium]